MDARSLVLLGSILTILPLAFITPPTSPVVPDVEHGDLWGVAGPSSARPFGTAVDPTFTDIGAGLGDVVEGSTAWGDYDNDGDLDVALTGLAGGAPITRLYRNTAGAFADVGAGLPGVYDGGAAWGDYDNDGDLDLALAGETGSGPITRVYRNSSGSFADIAASLPGIFYGSVAWADYDNDGDLDLALTGETGLGSIARVYRNTAGAFADAVLGLPGVFFSSLAWGDYDKDGDLDLVLTGETGSGAMARVYRNTGGSLADAGVALPGVSFSSVAWGDYDNDGDLDLLLTGDTGGGAISRIYRNSAGALADIGAGLPGVSFSAVAWGDCDNDGDLDLLLTGSTAVQPIASIYRNTAGSFADIGAGLPEVSFSSVSWGDYDNDRDLDIALTGDNGGAGLSRLYRNNSTVANTPPGAPSGLSVTLTVTTATFHWLAATDAQTPANGLSYNLRIGSTAGGAEILSPMAAMTNGYRRVVQLGNANQNLQWSVPKSSLSGGYFWSVQAVDHAFAGSAFASGPTVGVDDREPPIAYAMRSNVPNPFRAGTRIPFDLPVASRVEMRIFDVSGRLVKSLIHGELPAGTHEAWWNGSDESGRRVAAGTYFYRLRAGSYQGSRQMLMID